MSNKNSKEYEEAEIVSQKSASGGANRARAQSEEYAYQAGKSAYKQIVYSSLGTIFIFLFALFVAVALILTVLFWLLPFATAALIVTFLIAIVAAGYQAVRNFFGK